MADLVPYHDRDGFIWFDGKLVPWRDAKIHVLTHGLHYACCVFEGERAYGGEIFKLTRAQPAADRSAPSRWTSRSPTASPRSTRPAAKLVKATSSTDCYVRPIAWRGSEMMGVSAQKNKIHLAIAAWDWAVLFLPGAAAQGHPADRRQVAPARPGHRADQAKAAGLYMICTLSKHARRARGLCRRADVRLARPGRRGDRRQRLLRARTASCTRRRRTASSTASPGAR